jgi:hypothetical protein
MAHAHQTVLWKRPDGIQCVLIPYDERRYQLRLMRAQGTIKSDLFLGYGRAIAAAREWDRDLDAVKKEDGWPEGYTAREVVDRMTTR